MQKIFIVTSSGTEKKLEIDRKFENKLEIYKNLEIKLEIYYFKLEIFEFFVISRWTILEQKSDIVSL